MTQARPATANHHSRRARTALVLSVVLATAGIVATQPSSAQEGIAIPAPTRDVPVRPGATETAVVAGGCFWGIQGVFQHVTGVTNAVSGYAGGERQTAHYEMVGSGKTGHAEAVRSAMTRAGSATARSSRSSFPSLMTRPNSTGRGRMSGPNTERPSFREARSRLRGQGLYRATRPGADVHGGHRHAARAGSAVLPGGGLSPGFPDAQSDLSLHRYNDLPKIENLKRLFSDLYRERPVLALQSSRTN